jgi:hypothetical protein
LLKLLYSKMDSKYEVEFVIYIYLYVFHHITAQSCVLRLGCSICRKCLWVTSLNYECRKISHVCCGTCVSHVLFDVVAIGSYGLVVAVNGDVKFRVGNVRAANFSIATISSSGAL